LNWPGSFEQQRQRTGDLNILDWLRAIFGFQVCISYTEYGRKIFIVDQIFVWPPSIVYVFGLFEYRRTT